MALPTAVADPTKTMNGRYLWATFTPDGGSAIAIVAKKIDFESSVGNITRMIPVGDFISPDRDLPTTREQSFVLELDEFIQEVSDLVFGNTYSKGVCVIHIADPDDAALQAKLVSNSFACTMTAESGFSADKESFSSYSVRFRATAPITLSWDATA